jgi:c-di-AMP phosphodiesterase-like protein
MGKYRVINKTLGEVRADLHSLGQAIALAEQLAKAVDYADVYIVVETATVHETRHKTKE